LADGETRQHLLECEARTWLRRGYDSAERIEALTELISKKRGAASADRLVAEMRRQWRRRGDWLNR
jgi:replicative superfamily II helicase